MRLRDKESEPDNEVHEEGRERTSKRFKQDDEAAEEKSHQGGKKVLQSGTEEGRPTTSVVTRIRGGTKG